jgi:hypothetical protein
MVNVLYWSVFFPLVALFYCGCFRIPVVCADFEALKRMILCGNLLHEVRVLHLAKICNNVMCVILYTYICVIHYNPFS